MNKAVDHTRAIRPAEEPVGLLIKGAEYKLYFGRCPEPFYANTLMEYMTAAKGLRSYMDERVQRYSRVRSNLGLSAILQTSLPAEPDSVFNDLSWVLIIGQPDPDLPTSVRDVADRFLATWGSATNGLL